MLIIGRKIGESVVCGDVVVTLLQVQGNRVRVGIAAPAHVPIYRQENEPHGNSSFRSKYALLLVDNSTQATEENESDASTVV